MKGTVPLSSQGGMGRAFEKIPYALVEARRKNVLAHAAQFCRAGARINYASSFLRFRISLGLNSEPSKPHKKFLPPTSGLYLIMFFGQWGRKTT